MAYYIQSENTKISEIKPWGNYTTKQGQGKLYVGRMSSSKSDVVKKYKIKLIINCFKYEPCYGNNVTPTICQELYDNTIKKGEEHNHAMKAFFRGIFRHVRSCPGF